MKGGTAYAESLGECINGISEESGNRGAYRREHIFLHRKTRWRGDWGGEEKVWMNVTEGVRVREIFVPLEKGPSEKPEKRRDIMELKRMLDKKSGAWTPFWPL